MFGELINALDKNKGADGDTNAVFPRSDAEDLRSGATHIPDEVTKARRSGQKVTFFWNHETARADWYWQLPDGRRIRHG
jgi:hypothetical protein